MLIRIQPHCKIQCCSQNQDIVWQANLLPGLFDPPAIFGHEGAGIVRAKGARVHNKEIEVGDSVLLSFYFCRVCKRCTSGHPASCENGNRNFLGTREDGSTIVRRKADNKILKGQFFGQSSFARLSTVREACVVKFVGQVEDMGVFAACGCGFQTGAGTIINILKPERHESLVIFGMGAVGLTAVMGAKSLRVDQIIAVDLVESRLEIAKRVGATHTVNPTDVADMSRLIKKLTGGGATFCIDCTGVPKVIEAAIESVAPLG
jgi:Zn-dependent alcohol dehydrogenase